MDSLDQDGVAKSLGRYSRSIGLRLDGRADAADWVRRLRQSALADAEGRAFADTIKTVESFL